MCTNSPKDLKIPCLVFTIYGLIFGMIGLVGLLSLNEIDLEKLTIIQSSWNTRPIVDIVLSTKECHESLLNFSIPYRPCSYQDESKCKNLDSINWDYGESAVDTHICIQRLELQSFDAMIMQCSSDMKNCGSVCIDKGEQCPLTSIQINQNSSSSDGSEVLQVGDYYIHKYRNQQNQMPLIRFYTSISYPCLQENSGIESRDFFVRNDDCEQDKDFTSTGFQIPQSDFWSQNQDNLDLLESAGFVPSDQPIQIYQKQMYPYRYECRNYKWIDYLQGTDWLTEIRQSQILLVVFCFATTLFELVFIFPNSKKISGVCCSINFLGIVTLTSASLLGCALAINYLFNFDHFTDELIQYQCSTEFVNNSINEIDNQLNTPRFTNYIVLGGYCLSTLFLFIFHIYRTYFDPEGLGKTIDRINENARNTYQLKKRQLQNPYDPEKLKTMKKVLCPCIICLSNEPAPFYTRCCSQPMHSSCNVRILEKCPYCSKPGRVKLTNIPLYEDRAIMSESENIPKSNKLINLDLPQNKQEQPNPSSSHQPQIPEQNRNTNLNQEKKDNNEKNENNPNSNNPQEINQIKRAQEQPIQLQIPVNTNQVIIQMEIHRDSSDTSDQQIPDEIPDSVR